MSHSTKNRFITQMGPMLPAKAAEVVNVWDEEPTALQIQDTLNAMSEVGLGTNVVSVTLQSMFLEAIPSQSMRGRIHAC